MAANGLCSVVCFDHGLLLTFPTGFQTQADLLRSVWGMNTFFLLLLDLLLPLRTLMILPLLIQLLLFCLFLFLILVFQIPPS